MIAALSARELARAGRDRRVHYARWAIAIWLVVVLYFRHAAYYADWIVLSARGEFRAGATADFACRLVDYLIAQQTILLVLIVPAFAAGAVTDEKVRGTLEALFLAHLSPVSVILGKLIARVAQGFVWSLASWPVIALVGLPGGVTPVFFLALAVTTLLLLAGICAVSLLCSVWTRTTRDAVVISYGVLGFLMMMVLGAGFAGGRWSWLAALNPEYVLDAARHSPDYPELGRRLRDAVLGWSFIAVACTAIASWRLRPAYIKQLGRRTPQIASTLQFRPAIDDRPVAWKEQYTARWPRWVGWLITGFLAFLVTIGTQNATGSVSQTAEALFQWQWTLLFFVSLAAGARASAGIVAERDRKTWEVLLTVPDDFERIIDQKLSGIVDAIWPYWISAACCAGLTLSIFGLRKSDDWMLFSFSLLAGGLAVYLLRKARVPWVPWCGLALATACAGNAGWLLALVPFCAGLAAVSMRLMAAVGLYISARSSSGWVSLVMTVIIGYLVGAALIGASTPLACLSCCTLMIFAAAVRDYLGADGIQLWPYFWGIGCLLALWWGSVVFRAWTVAWLVRHERVPDSFVRRTMELESD
ncbi:MAG: ABC transporter permease [Gemmataceae bacterium]|nr:ABC transporter permease [Gemmataceae bacterium]